MVILDGKRNLFLGKETEYTIYLNQISFLLCNGQINYLI